MNHLTLHAANKMNRYQKTNGIQNSATTTSVEPTTLTEGNKIM